MVEVTYHKEGDFFVPDLYLEKEDYENDYIIGKYGLKIRIFKKSEEIRIYNNVYEQDFKKTYCRN